MFALVAGSGSSGPPFDFGGDAIFNSPSPLNSATPNSRAVRSSSAKTSCIFSFFTGVPCFPIPCSLAAPHPFTVRAMIANGRLPFLITFSSLKAFEICSGSCPSITRAMNPNASAFFASVSALCCGLTQSLCASSLQLKIATTLVSAWSAIKSIASQICPSRDSPSPIRQ
jgi:hypothetical protein